ncbi:hypothetical protein FJZ31_20100 [Candidatus Poribacteria bacterium]|nr:hypothetical protein [Candidatus Poribacteria bacterium]
MQAVIEALTSTRQTTDRISEYPSASNPDFIYLSTPSGLLRYDKRSDEWTFAATHPLLQDSIVHDIGVDEDFIWIATDKGIASAMIGSVEWKVYTLSDGLPDDNGAALAFHSDYVWAGTVKGIAKFDKYVEEWESVQVPELSRGVSDIAVWGDTVWVVSPTGIFSLDVETGEAQRHPIEEYFFELIQAGGDIWFLGEKTAQRYVPTENIWREYGAEQGFPQNPTDVKVEGQTVWLSSPKGISSYEPTLDRWMEFLPLRSSPVGVEVKGVAPDGGYLWVLTPKGVGRYDRTTGAWRRFREIDGLTVKEELSITVDGNYVFVVGVESIGIYYKSRDSWRTYPYDSIEAPTGKAGKKLISIEPSGLTLTPSDSARFAISGISSFGFKMEPEIGNFDFWNSLNLHGEFPSQRSMSGTYDDVRERRYKLEYRGAPKDIIKGITVGEAQFRPFSSALLDNEAVLGAGAKLSKGSTRSELWLAQRRGIPHVDFLRGEMGEREIFSMTLSHKDIIPYSERIFVDGSLMQRNVHYLIDYTQGWVIFNTPDVVDPDSRIRVEYQYREASAEGRFSSIQLETKQMGDKADFGAIFTDFLSESNRYLATSEFARWENKWLAVQPEIAYANPNSHLAGAFTLELKSEKTDAKADYRRFSPGFPATINRLTEFGKLTDELNFETSAHLWDSSSFSFQLNSGNSHTGAGNFAMANFKLNPQGLPSFMFSGRYDALNTPAEKEERIGAKIGVGYDLPKQFLERLRLSELGFSSCFGSTRLDLGEPTPYPLQRRGEKELGINEGSKFRYDTYWKMHAGIKAGASANIYQRFSHLPDYTVRRTVLGMQMLAVPGIHSSLYLDFFKTEDKSSQPFVALEGRPKKENLLSANLSVFPGNWSSLLGWLDILSGYTVIERSEADRVRSTLVRPTVRLSQRSRFLANWTWNESEGTRFDAELLYTPDFGRIGVDFSTRPQKGKDGLEKKLMPWCEFRLLGMVNGLRLSLTQTPEGNFILSPEHLIRHYIPMKWLLRSAYFANSFSLTRRRQEGREARGQEIDRISDSLLAELSTSFSLTFRLSGTVIYDLDSGEADVKFFFRGYAKL